jgi:membrane protein DedA with SNARE-associated domain
VFTITSGMIGFNLLIFFFICLISRGLRFFIVSYLSFKFGDTFDKFMQTKAAKWFTVMGVLIVVIFGVIYFIIK